MEYNWPTNTRQWYTVVELENLRPEEVKVKLDRERHVLLVLRVPRTTFPYTMKRGYENHIVRTIRLPKNICLRKLKVHITPRNELVVKAPYCNEMCEEKDVMKHRRPQYLENAFPLMHKKFPNLLEDDEEEEEDEETCEQDIFKRRRPWHMRNTIPTIYNRFFVDEEEDETDSEDEEEDDTFPMKKWGQLENETTMPNTLGCKIIRDPTTGMKKVLFEVNTIGFRKEEIRVKLNKEKRVLIVKAVHHVQPEYELQEKIIVPKFLLREFILPRGVLPTQIVTRVTKKGTLLVEVPLMTRRQNDFPRMGLENERTFMPRFYYL